jgi:hypothetical protein
MIVMTPDGYHRASNAEKNRCSQINGDGKGHTWDEQGIGSHYPAVNNFAEVVEITD